MDFLMLLGKVEEDAVFPYPKSKVRHRIGLKPFYLGGSASFFGQTENRGLYGRDCLRVDFFHVTEKYPFVQDDDFIWHGIL